MKVTDHIRKHLLDTCGCIPVKKIAPLEELQQTEWSSEFEQLMRNRLIVGAIRYQRFNHPDKPNYNRIGAIERKLKAYIESGNTELLVDIANYCLLEFVFGSHPKKHFHAQDDVDHCRIGESHVVG